MSTYADEVRKAQAAQMEVWRAGAAVEARRRAVARAWHLRPGGVEWADLLRDINADLPVGAWLTRGTVRNDEKIARPKEGTRVAGPSSV